MLSDHAGSHSRPSRWAVITVCAAIALAALLAWTARATAISAPIRIAGTGGEGVFIRLTPDTSHPAVGWMAEGTSPDYNCFTYGQMVGNINVWFYVNHAGVTGYYASYFDDSSYHSEAELESKYGIPKCGATTTAPAPSPPSGESAIPAPTVGSAPSATAPAAPTPTAGAASPDHATDPCMDRYARTSSSTTSHGRTIHNRSDSLRMVCAGFGAPEGLQVTAGMGCELIAQIIGVHWKRSGLFISGSCSGAALASQPDRVSQLSVACGYLSDLLGVPYRLAGRIAGLACASAPSFGRHLEATHELAVAADVQSHGMCVELRKRWLLGLSWNAIRCP